MKVRMIDLDKIDIARKQVDNIEIKSGLYYDGDYKDFNDRLNKEFDTIEFKENSLFTIHITDFTNMNKEEKKHIAQFVVNTLCQYLLLDSPRDREVRLSSPIAVKVNPIILLDLINKKTKIDKFSIQVFINGERVYKL